VARISVADQVYDILIKKITDGEWQVGDKIPSEIELSEQLGVSRVSLKLALQKMQTLGITETRIGEGTFVCDFNMTGYFTELFRSNILEIDMKQLNEFRILVEYNVMRLAINHQVSEEDINELRTILKNMSQAIAENNIENYHSQHFLFHQTICNMSHNQLFMHLYYSLHGILFGIYKNNSEKTWESMGREESVRHHRDILEAIGNRDLEKCYQLMDELLTHINDFV
jgi:Transcriptional regulators